MPFRDLGEAGEDEDGVEYEVAAGEIVSGNFVADVDEGGEEEEEEEEGEMTTVRVGDGGLNFRAC